MDDLRDRFASLDLVPVPDLWSDVERRLDELVTKLPTRRLVAVSPAWRAAIAETSAGSANTLRRRSAVALLAAAVLIAALLIGGAIAVGSGLVRLPSVFPPSRSPEARLASPPASSLAEVSPSLTITPSPTPDDALPARAGMFADLRDFLVASDTVTWVSTSSALYRTRDTGTTWTDIRPQGWSTTAATALIDGETVYVASGGSPATIAATHDGGATWIETSIDVGDNSGGPVFSFQSPVVGFASFYDTKGSNPWHVYATTDGGGTWTGPKNGKVPHIAESFDKLYPPIGGFLWQSAGKADNKPFDNRFFLSADGGVNWTQYTFPIGALAPKNDMKTIGAIVREDNGRFLLAIGVDGGRNPIPEAIYESGDDTASWRLVNALPDTAFEVQFLSPTEWVITSSHGLSEVRSSIDGGDHWRTVVASTSIYDLDGYQFASRDTGWATEECQYRHGAACGATPRAKVLLVTTDGGLTWKPIGD